MPTSRGRRPTIKDVAARAGVAPMTVSYAFNHPARVAEATRATVLAAAADLGYRPDSTARALRSGRTRQLGVVVGEHLSYLFDDPQAAQFLAGIADVCVTDNLGMVLLPTRGDADDVDRVLAAAVDGYVLWTTTADDPVLAAVAGSGRPAAIQGGPAHPGLAHVGPDDRAAAAAVAEATALADATPVVISFPLDRRRASGLFRGRDLPTDVPFPVTAARLGGYHDALTRAGHDWADVRVAVVQRNQRTLGEQAAAAVLEEVDSAGPVVILAMSDELALGARAGVADPQRDITLTGWDGSREASAAGIWTVAASLRDQGRACARAALSGDLDHQDVPWRVVAPAGSTANR
ncbi:LacI family DNA-binding transcriptional regulator [Calidifontibacter sp. DB0510]|uniref:LacI family DNA-binding transcriptional regulator n=1 Tax=Metallococcus carri TaxID=1656884 RepID=A0A967AZW8_9MICO|nr:LacI family DNA-binding transcriptional regulator [Metallococcus carri]NHN55492.1 LacI family DNA-binding transcriptional regulator [Metallococcus carri]NOP38324.1 LacI family DNA-binding transcriptional regulator [Calidifontibacter sp. DB2511S]